DVVGDDGDDAVRENPDALQRLARAGGEDGRRLRINADALTHVAQHAHRQGDQRTGGVVLTVEAPRLFRREDQLAAQHAFDAHALRQGQRVWLAVGPQRPDLRAEGVQRTAEQHRLDRPRLVAEHDRRDAIAAVALLAAIDLGRVFQRVTA